MKARTLKRKNVMIFLIYHLFVLIAIPLYFLFCSLTLSPFIWGFFLFFASGMGVTAGYHRYFSHHSYKAHPVVECVLLFFASLALQGSAYQWSHDHRLHHAHVDTDKDPYSINKGFWYAHFIWLLEPSSPLNERVVSDLKKNPRVMFQHKYPLSMMFATNFLVWLGLGFLTGDFLGTFMIAVVLRIFCGHHATWFINSLAHTWGERPFSKEQTAVNNYIISFLTFGEGYHNYHHVFAKDYRVGVRWFHFDPTKWLVWTLEKLGLVSDLHRTDKKTIENKMLASKEVD